MTEQLDMSDWQVPSHEVALFAERTHLYALVIPVINEGERIRGQLQRIAEAAPHVDVIIADGGSTDGSLDPAFIESVNVRAVLTKTGPGKLSAQLRMAYAWCLREGYDGIVTMDGNGKDGVEAIAAMVAKLDEGCDYVQGSRYLPGGAAENTPLERTIANRLIHAPVLSLAGRHLFTDTTNGFRAYSTRYLTDPRVRPFRDEFEVYGLLFYLTVRAGQLGLKVGHVPVTRRYPENGKVPTKIEGLAPKLALLGETVFAATGGHTPAGAEPRAKGLIWSLIVLLALLIPLLLSVWAAPPYSPDSWAFYELSRTIFGDFYRFDHFRSYASMSDYSSAFPPLWPTLIALVDEVLGTGARSGLLLAFTSFAGFALVSESIARRLTGASWIGLSAAIVLLLGPSMMLIEMQAGRTIPLQMLFFSLIVLCFTRAQAITVKGAIAIGALAGLAVMNRFDAALLPLLSAGAILWFTRRPGHALASLAASLVMVSPWIAYSLSTFGSLFATDNAGTATSLDPAAFVTDWWPEEQPNWTDSPGQWLAKVVGNLGSLLWVGAQLSFTAMGFAVLAAMGAVFAVQHLEARRPHAPRQVLALADELTPLVAFVVISALMLAPQVLTGYFEYRYYNAFFWSLAVLNLCWLILRARTAHQRQVYGAIASAVILLSVAALVIAPSIHSSLHSTTPESASARFDAPADVSLLRHCLAHDPEARVLVVGDDSLAARAGAIAGLHTMMEPRNMAQGRLDAEDSRHFFEAFAVDYVLIADPLRGPTQQADSAARFAVEPVSDCPLMLFKLLR